MTHSGRPQLEQDPPFLENDPPHWAARGLSTALLVLFATAVVAAAVVRVPETVDGPFVLVSERGADPVRAAREGTVADVRVSEGQAVAKGATLFVIRSQAVGDRVADMRGTDMQKTGVEQRLANARVEHESQRRADSLEGRRLDGRLASTERILILKRKQLASARDMAARGKLGADQGIVGGWDADRMALDADRLATELESTIADQEETRAALGKLRQDAMTRDIQYRELVRGLEQDRQVAEARLESMRGQLTGGSPAGDLVVTAPCTGSLLRMMVNTPGAIVQAGDALGEVACAGDRLQVEMTLGQQEVARVRVGQGAKLLYDAFPYQRYGVKAGNVRWVGPATIGHSSGADQGAGDVKAFRALIDASDSTIMVSGEPRPLLFGMRGRAKVVTGRRTLISFAFEPIRALRENFASVEKPSK
jgi:multidrug efflux pump subunit AcrA (membrane-fusion protein)